MLSLLLGVLLEALGMGAASAQDQGPERNGIGTTDTEPRRFPTMEWQAGDIRPGAPIRAEHIRDLRVAHDWLYDRFWSERSDRHECTGAIARWVLAYRHLESETELADFQQAIALEDRIRDACGF